MALQGMEIKVSLLDQGVAERFRRSGDAVREAALSVISDAAQEVETAMRSGAPRKTGRAAASIKARVIQKPGRITAYIGPSRRFRYIEQMEYGTVGTYDVSPGPRHMGVKGHPRRNRAGDVYAYGAKGRRSRVGVGVSYVKTYVRVAHMPAKPFARPAFALVESSLPERLEKAVEAAMGFGS